MKKTTKLIALLVVLCMVCTVVLTACNSGKEDALNKYILPQDQTIVSDDFTLPATIGTADAPVAVTWTSSNDAIKIGAKDGDVYPATVTLGKGSITEVTLTVSAGGKLTKDFTVRVDYYDVYKFADSYVFTQKGLTVGANFALDTECSYKGEKATISWEVPEASKNYLSVEGNQCLVVIPEGNSVEVSLKATFSYNNETCPVTYKFYVGETLEHLQQINTWYTDGGVVAIDGYVVGLAQNYQGKNVSVYMVDEDFCCGFYLYSISYDMTKVDELKPGTAISVSGATVQAPYYGLIETRNGDLVLSNKDSIDLDEHIYAADNDLIGNWLEATYHTGVLASITNWEVTAVDTNVDVSDKGERGAFLTVKKGDVEVKIAYQKYMEGYYVPGDDTLAAIKTKAGTIAVGDYVSVKGILYVSGSGSSKSSAIDGNWQLIPRSADDIVKGTADTTAKADLVGTKLKAAIAEVNAAVADLPAIVVVGKEVTVPTTSNGVTISYSVCGSQNAVKVEDGKIKITPQSYKDTRDIQVTYKVGEFESHSFIRIVSQALTNEEIVEIVAGDLASAVETTYEAIDTYDLPTETEYDGVVITWSLKGTSNLVSVANNKLTVVAQPAEDAKVTIELKVELSGANASKEVEITIKAGDANLIAKFTFGSNDSSKSHTDGSAITDGQDYEAATYGSYTLTLTNPSKVYSGAYDDKGNACLKLGTSSAAASFSFTVDDSVNYVKIYVAKYKTYTTGISINGGDVKSLTKNSNDGAYDVIVVDTTTNKTVKIETAQLEGDTNKTFRCMISMIEWLVSND